MFRPGQIIYFYDFYFKNGNKSKPKYFIVLANFQNTTIIASLPTRTNSVPAFVNQPHGCIDIEERCYNCYVFEKDRVIGQNGFSFYMQTFIYGDEVEDYDMEIMEDIYKIEGIDYEILDVLKNEEYTAIILCLLNSKSVKSKIKKYLRNIK